MTDSHTALLEERRGFLVQRPVIRVNGSGRMGEGDAAAYLGVSARTMRLMRERDEGPAFHRVRGRIWYSLTDLDEYIDACRHETAR